MKFYTLLVLSALFLTCFAFISSAEDRLFVGVSPSIIDLGEIERGTTNLVKFYIVTISEDPILVSLEPENGRLDFFDNNYVNSILNFSEEDTASWVKFLSNPVELKPQNETLSTNYESIKGWREVDFLLEVPRNAEAGYHLIKVKPTPIETSVTKEAVGANVIAITSINVIFKIPGDAKREGMILDSTPGKYGQNNLEINTYFQNTGTTTITAKAIQRVYDKDRNFITEISSPKLFVKPSEVKTLNSFLPLTNLSFGDYQVLTTVSYTTDSAYKNSTISISSEALLVRPKEDSLSWIFIIIIIIIAIMIYRWIH
jgi:hypothetical protein